MKHNRTEAAEFSAGGLDAEQVTGRTDSKSVIYKFFLVLTQMHSRHHTVLQSCERGFGEAQVTIDVLIAVQHYDD